MTQFLKWLSAQSFTEFCYGESFTTCNCSVGLHTKNTAFHLQGGSNMTGTDLYVNKPRCAAAVRP